MQLSIAATTDAVRGSSAEIMRGAGGRLKVALFLSGAELAGNGYARQTASLLASATAGVDESTVSLAAPLIFTPTSGGRTFDQVKIYNASGAVLLWSGDVTLPVAFSAGDPLSLMVSFSTQIISEQTVDELRVYVAIDGDDAATGTIDDALETVAGARDFLRGLKADDLIDRPVAVYLREGVYRQAETLEWTEEDNGTDENPITYQPYPGEEAVISGAELIPGAWTNYSGSIKYIDLPGHADFRSLIVGGVLATRARSPSLGSYYMMQSFGAEGTQSDHFYANVADLPTFAAGIEVNAFCGFQHSRSFLSSIASSGTPRRVNVTGGPINGFNNRPDFGRYFYENALEFLTEAGEFFWDNTAKRLYYWARPGQVLGSAVVEIPAVTELINLSGSANAVEWPSTHAVYSITYKTSHTDAAAFWQQFMALQKYPPGYNGLRIGMRKNGGVTGFLFIEYGGAGYVEQLSPASLNNGAWHTVTLGIDLLGGTLKIWSDGVFVSNNNIGAGVTMPTDPPQIGGDQSVGVWDGELADFIILDSVGSDAIALALHEQNYATIQDSMIVHFPLLEDFHDDVGLIGDVESETNYESGGAAVHSNPLLTGTGALFDGVNDFINLRNLPAQRVEFINFSGLIFESVDWTLIPTGHTTYESGYNPLESQAIVMRRANACGFANCTIRNVGAVGVLLDLSTDCIVDHCLLDGIGASPIVNNGRDHAVHDDISGGQILDNNTIVNYGQVSRGGIGIFSQHSGRNSMRHNEISYGSYMGIRSYCTLNALQLSARENDASDNHIHHVMQELYDGGGIYFSGRQPGSMIARNWIHDLPQTSLQETSEHEGIYLDFGASGILITGNLVYRVANNPIFCHGANDCDITNNIFIDGGDQARNWTFRSLLLFGNGAQTRYPNGCRWKNNIFSQPSGRADSLTFSSPSYLALMLAEAAIGDSDYNVFWPNSFTVMMDSGGSTDYNLTTLRAAYAIEKHSVAADPKFVDPDNDDYTLMGDSPALALGFVPLDLSAVGPQ